MALIVGHLFSAMVLAGMFVLTEVIFSIVLAIEVRNIAKLQQS
ncbi:hypothetical protein [Butyrivibrio sp. AE3009]|nr:hypothetical protein [Butyrivibrio sp. AE3009]